MEPTTNPYLTQPVIVVLKDLIQDIKCDIEGTPRSHNPDMSPKAIGGVVYNKDQIVDHEKQTVQLFKVL